MISFIICSIDPVRCEAIQHNIRSTCGLSEAEFLVHDNRELHWGLCKVYNHMARKASYPQLCFVHEDITFLTQDWGEKILSIYRENPMVGVVGFFGAQVKTQSPSPVGYYRKYDASNYVKHHRNGKVFPYIKRTGTGDLSRVIQIDGMCMFVPKAIWEELPFDEETFDGFHLYDLDFTVQVALRYENYVCHSVLVDHAQEGVHNEAWFRYTKLFHEKWRAQLPLSTHPLGQRAWHKVEAYTAYKFYKKALRAGREEYIAYGREAYRAHRSLCYTVRLLRYLTPKMPHRL